MSYVILAILLVLSALTALLYNRLIRDRNRVNAAWSDGYERATLEAVTNLRAQAMQIRDVTELGDAEEELSVGVQRLLAVAEQYPDLKANENFLNLQTELAETENYLQFARRYYNGSVRQFNTRTETVPDNMIAGWFGFTPRSYFQKTSDDAANVPLVNLGNIE